MYNFTEDRDIDLKLSGYDLITFAATSHTLNLTQPHLPSFVMTYRDLATQLNQTFKSQPNLDGSPQNFQHRPPVGKQV